MSRSAAAAAAANATAPADTIPSTARAIALLLASTPAVHDAQPAVLHQLLDFSHRYTAQVLSDALIYAEHAGHSGKVEMEDVVLAVQARVGWEYGGRVPKEYILSLAAHTNAQPLPAVPEVFGVRLPPAGECLTAVDFDLVPHAPPPAAQQFDEEVEEVEESASEDEDADMEPAPIPHPHPYPHPHPHPQAHPAYTPSDVEMAGAEAAVAGPVGAPGVVGLGVSVPVGAVPNEVEEGSEEEDGLFAGGDDEESGGEDAMEEVTAPGAAAEPGVNGMKRKLVEEEDYD